MQNRRAFLCAGVAVTALHTWAQTDDKWGALRGYPESRSSFERLPEFRVGNYSGGHERYIRHNTLRSSDRVVGWSDTPVNDFRYRFGLSSKTPDAYLAQWPVTGLLIARDNHILFERYRFARQPAMRLQSWSMAKSVTSLLIGSALSRGVIKSIDDPASVYVKDLADSPYGQTSIRHLLRMSSGLRFTERYDGQDDVARLSRSVATGNPSVNSMLRSITDRHSPAGEKFIYASAETEVLGRVLTAAAGKSMAELTSEWLWKPIGAEQDAFWCTAKDRQEGAYFCFNAALRDWGRLGHLLAQDGKVGDQQVIPKEYLLDATDPTRQPAAFKPYRATPSLGYGYQFWLLPQKERSFGMQGIHGQTVFVQPSSGIVMVQTAVYAGASGALDPDPYAERASFWLGVLQSLGGNTDRY